jgi:thiamine kinase
MGKLEKLDDCDLPFSNAPKFLRTLLGGRSNNNTLIEADGALWVLRISTPNVSQFGIDRSREEIALQKAADAGIAPRIAYRAQSKGILITEFIDGRHWAPSALAENSKFDELVSLIKRVHELDNNLPVTDYYQHAENYWTQLVSAGCDIPRSLRSMRDRVNEQQSEALELGAPSTLCHRDISPSNVIEKNGRLFLIDWEYAARGSPTFDYASIRNEWHVTAKRLIDAAELSSTQLHLACDLYQYTCRLWELLNLTLEHRGLH